MLDQKVNTRVLVINITERLPWPGCKGTPNPFRWLPQPLGLATLRHFGARVLSMGFRRQSGRPHCCVVFGFGVGATVGFGVGAARCRCGCRIQECSVCQQLSVISYRLRLLAVDAFAGGQSQPASTSSRQSACSISEKSSACVGRNVCVCLLPQRPVFSSQRPAVVASRQPSQ